MMGCDLLGGRRSCRVEQVVQNEDGEMDESVTEVGPVGRGVLQTELAMKIQNDVLPPIPVGWCQQSFKADSKKKSG
jgi:hypothetical protein